MRLIRFRLHASRLFFAFKNTPHHHHHHHRVFTPTPTQQSRASDGGEHKNHPPPPPPPPAAETRGVDVLLRREKTQTQKGNDFQIIIIRRRLYRWGTPGRDPKETTGTPKSSSGRPERRRKGTTRFVAKTKNAVAEKERWQPSVSRVDFDDDFDGGHNCPTK